jgi:hypothetical protein
MKMFDAVLIFGGRLRRLVFEAADEKEAQILAITLGVGLEGEHAATGPVTTVLPEAFNAADARIMLGKIGLSTLYDMVYDGRLERVPGIRKLLIKRRSIERYVNGR